MFWLYALRPTPYASNVHLSTICSSGSGGQIQAGKQLLAVSFQLLASREQPRPRSGPVRLMADNLDECGRPRDRDDFVGREVRSNLSTIGPWIELVFGGWMFVRPCC